MIVASNPTTGLDTVEQAYFDSDATTNDAAIREIDAVALRHGLVRVNEYWLQIRRTTNGTVVRRGFCYRPERAGGLGNTLEPISGGADVVALDVIREMRDH